MDSFKAGEQYFNAGEYRLAIEHYVKVLILKPDHLRALVNLCISYYEVEEYSYAIETANQILQIDPMNEYAFTYRGKSHHELAQYLKAEFDFTNLIELDPYEEFYYLNRSHIRKHLGKYKEAESDMKTYKMLSNKTSAIYFSNCEEAEITDDDLDEFNLARQKLGEIIKAQPGNYKAYHGLGVAYTKIFAHQKAIEAYTKAMEVYPGKMYKEALLNRINAYFDNYQYDKCLSDIDTFKKEFQMSPYLKEIVRMIREDIHYNRSSEIK